MASSGRRDPREGIRSMCNRLARFFVIFVLLLLPVAGLAVERTVLFEKWSNGW